MTTTHQARLVSKTAGHCPSCRCAPEIPGAKSVTEHSPKCVSAYREHVRAWTAYNHPPKRSSGAQPFGRLSAAADASRVESSRCAACQAGAPMPQVLPEVEG